MTSDSRHLLEEFNALPDGSKREVLAQLLRAARFIDYPEMSDDELSSAANDVFLEYDHREATE